MEISPLELGLAAAAVFVVFGPKKLPKKKQVEVLEQVDLSALTDANRIDSIRPASQHAAGRAPSPLSVNGAPPIYAPERDLALAEDPPQYTQASKLPHEFAASESGFR